MLHKCENPACSGLSRTLIRGKLFLLDRDTSGSVASGVSPAFAGGGPGRQVERYWLCDHCSSRHTLIFERGPGRFRFPSPPGRVDVSRARPIGELAVHRESVERVLMENPYSLQVVLDALLDALGQKTVVEVEPVSLREAQRQEEKELCAVSTEPEF